MTIQTDETGANLAASGRKPILRVEGLRKSFGQHEVLKSIDLDVDLGEVVVIFGRSGSGKSTLLRCINFLEEPTAGTMWHLIAISSRA